MKLELTERDILLIKLSVSALIVFICLRFFLLPGIEQLQENTLQLDEQEQAVQQLQEAIAGIPALEQGIERKKQELKKRSADYYEPMENRQVDELLTGIALRHGLFPVSLSIEGAAAAIPQPYPYAHGEAPQPEAPAAENCVYTARGRMVLSGEESALFAFVGDVEENYPAIQLRTLSRREYTYFDSEWDVVEQVEMSCELAVYMADSAARPQAPAEAQGE